MSEALISTTTRARFIVSLPPKPNALAAHLARAAAASFTTLTDTRDAFLHLARRARDRLVIMTPFIDHAGARWASELFAATQAADKILIVRDRAKLQAFGDTGVALTSAATRILQYEIPQIDDRGRSYTETFHAKIVLADGVAAYVGSANFLHRSRDANLECGFLLEGDAVSPVMVLVNAVIDACQPP
jgi:phosphatidylserine/phosphatidylglycerophosphate/cardiolipin synthase-like enzyme